MEREVSLKEMIGGGYKDFWECKKRYRVVKGSRGSKKSTTTAFWIILNMMKYSEANTLVIRRLYVTHKDSTYAQLVWAINRLGVGHLWKCKLSPLELIYRPTGQKIMFRGFDNPLSITSITVATGHLCWCWIEEAYQITKEDDFNKLDMSIRGELPEGLFKQITITFNPWTDKHWLKSRFFDDPDENTFISTTTYRCNEWLGEDDRKLFDDMRIRNPRRFAVEGDGEWGISEGLVYDNWCIAEAENAITFEEFKQRKGIVSIFGLDFGYTADPTALVCALVDEEKKEMLIFDEHYQYGMTNEQIAAMIKYKGYAKERIIADSAEHKSIDQIRLLGVRRIEPAAKGSDSVSFGIQFLQGYKIYVLPKCQNIILELSNYRWDESRQTGKLLNKPIGEYNHALDALRYASEQLQRKANVQAAARLR